MHNSVIKLASNISAGSGISKSGGKFLLVGEALSPDVFRRSDVYDKVVATLAFDTINWGGGDYNILGYWDGQTGWPALANPAPSSGGSVTDSIVLKSFKILALMVVDSAVVGDEGYYLVLVVQGANLSSSLFQGIRVKHVGAVSLEQESYTTFSNSNATSWRIPISETVYNAIASDGSITAEFPVQRWSFKGPLLHSPAAFIANGKHQTGYQDLSPVAYDSLPSIYFGALTNPDDSYFKIKSCTASNASALGGVADSLLLAIDAEGHAKTSLGAVTIEGIGTFPSTAATLGSLTGATSFTWNLQQFSAADDPKTGLDIAGKQLSISVDKRPFVTERSITFATYNSGTYHTKGAQIAGGNYAALGSMTNTAVNGRSLRLVSFVENSAHPYLSYFTVAFTSVPIAVFDYVEVEGVARFYHKDHGLYVDAYGNAHMVWKTSVAMFNSVPANTPVNVQFFVESQNKTLSIYNQTGTKHNKGFQLSLGSANAATRGLLTSPAVSDKAIQFLAVQHDTVLGTYELHVRFFDPNDALPIVIREVSFGSIPTKYVHEAKISRFNTGYTLPNQRILQYSWAITAAEFNSVPTSGNIGVSIK